MALSISICVVPTIFYLGEEDANMDTFLDQIANALFSTREWFWYTICMDSSL